MTDAPYRPPLPSSDALVDWPSSFGQRFTIMVDTEEEFDWSAPFSRDARSVSATSAIPDAAARMAAAGAPLTFLVDHPIATDARAIDHLRAALDHSDNAVGAQLHPWVNPPHDEVISAANSYAGRLSPALEAAKIGALTDAITAVFEAPRIYRAGRYGIGPATLGILAELRYRFDSSIRARYDYSADGGPNFSRQGNSAFRCGPADALIELPLTTVYTGGARAIGSPLYRVAGSFPKGRGLLARTGLLSRVALTPEGMPLNDAREAVRIAAGEGLRLLNFGFHSPSLAPGHTPYVRDAADLAAFWHWWDEMFALLARLGIAPASLGDLLAAVGRDAGGPGRT